MGPDSRILQAYFPNHSLQVVFQVDTGFHLVPTYRVVAFPCLAKQLAKAPEGHPRMPLPKAVHCLAPAFFSKSTPNCSRPILRTSFRASLRSSEYSRALRRRMISSSSSSSRVLDAFAVSVALRLRICPNFLNNSEDKGNSFSSRTYAFSQRSTVPWDNWYLRQIDFSDCLDW